MRKLLIPAALAAALSLAVPGGALLLLRIGWIAPPPGTDTTLLPDASRQDADGVRGAASARSAPLFAVMDMGRLELEVVTATVQQIDALLPYHHPKHARVWILEHRREPMIDGRNFRPIRLFAIEKLTECDGSARGCTDRTPLVLAPKLVEARDGTALVQVSWRHADDHSDRGRFEIDLVKRADEWFIQRVRPAESRVE